MDDALQQSQTYFQLVETRMKLRLQIFPYTLGQWCCLYTTNTLFRHFFLMPSSEYLQSLNSSDILVLAKICCPISNFQSLSVKICLVPDLCISVDKWKKRNDQAVMYLPISSRSFSALLYDTASVLLVAPLLALLMPISPNRHFILWNNVIIIVILVICIIKDMNVSKRGLSL